MRISCIVVLAGCLSVTANASLASAPEYDTDIQEIRVFLNRYLDLHRWLPQKSLNDVSRKQYHARELLRKIAEGTLKPEIMDGEALRLITGASLFLRSPLDPEAVVVFYDLLQATENEHIRRKCAEFIESMSDWVPINIKNTESVADLARRYDAGEFEPPEIKRLVARILADSGSGAGRQLLESAVDNEKLAPSERFTCALSLYALDPECDELQKQVIGQLIDSSVPIDERFIFFKKLKRYGTDISEAVVATAIEIATDHDRYLLSELLVVSGDVRGVAMAQLLIQKGSPELSAKALALLTSRIATEIDPATPANELKWNSRLRVFTRETNHCEEVRLQK